MSELLKAIRETLPAEDAQALREFDRELGVYGRLGESLKPGPDRWLVVLVLAMTPVMMGLLVWSAVTLVTTDAPRTRDLAAVLTVGCLVAIAAYKSWLAMELNRRDALHEARLIRLQLARLARRLEGATTGDAPPTA